MFAGLTTPTWTSPNRKRLDKMRKITTVIADGRTLIRECLRAILETYPELQLIAEAAEGHELVRLCDDLQPGLAVINLRLKELDGAEATRRVLSVSPATKVLIICTPADSHLVCEALKAGASGFLLHDSSSGEISEAIAAVTANGRYVTPELREVVGDGRGCGMPPAVVELLTRREQEILVLLARGKTSRDIAQTLSISTKTVETHRSHLMKKLDLTNIASLTKYAIRVGLLPLD